MSNVADVYDKIRMLNMFRLNPDRFLPIVDHAWKVFPKEDPGTESYDDRQVNIGWDTGLLGADRPYFAEGWATCGITMLTYFISTDGIGEYGVPELLAMLERAKLVKVLDPSRPRTDILKYEDDNGREFFSINIAAGDEEGTYVSGGKMYPFAALNRYNRNREKEAGGK